MEDYEFVQKMHFQASYNTSNKLFLVPRHILTTDIQKCLSSWQCKIHKFTVTTFHSEQSMHCKYKQPSDFSNARQQSKELTTLPEPPNNQNILLKNRQAFLSSKHLSLLYFFQHSQPCPLLPSTPASACPPLPQLTLIHQHADHTCRKPCLPTL